jgi:hypothetical protein
MLVGDATWRFKEQRQLAGVTQPGAVGLIIAFALPGGLTGGQGFLIGFLGSLAIVLMLAYTSRSARTTRQAEPFLVHCPYCERTIQICITRLEGEVVSAPEVKHHGQ